MEVAVVGAGPLGRVLKGLRTQDILVVKGSFDKMEVTLEELGVSFGVSKERVRQLEERARGKLRAELEEVWAEAS